MSGWGMLIAGLIVVAVFAAARLLRRHLTGRAPDSEMTDLSQLTRGPRLFGFAVIAVFFGGFGVWSVIAPLSSAALAPGVVSPDGSRKTVQHLDGGIIRQIYVREGDHVRAGEPLIALEETRALSRYEDLRERQIYLLSAEARLTAEQLGKDTVDYPALVRDDDATGVIAMASEDALFQDRRETQRAREDILSRRVAQLEEENLGLSEVIAVQDEQLDLISQEMDAALDLYQQGLERLPRVLELKRQRADIHASQASNKAAIARNGQQIAEAELQLLASRQQIREEASRQLTEARGELASLRNQLAERADVLARTQVSAPISGMVMNVQVTTEAGGVLRPGAPILDIVPEDARLIVDARVRPLDIESVRPEMRARVVLTAYNQRFMPQIFGRVRSVSADRLVDERNGEAYFLAKIEVPPEEIDKLGGTVDLVSGMPVDVMILTGETTLADLLLRPIAESLRKSFRDS
ncbi:HlyD family type I secretion periplasmic adaptor subunit [Albidovulum sediminicola]|uniref:Membrane fusion protein (MFP) family protein n=1 Tax=Albidovulum sediminicola TaxID=2984331 RepID=A0ABT2Z698_9RHOB|nr:HlyD family type I secretion periplasmic adaptor subunit [Defluviimonas sp. WL0075]MCV2866667.1 HlyD family type I secretion periplasmic adaptor subunit [Defluviimonas sp. WL0075]